MLTDDMKMLHSKNLKVQDVRRYDVDNAKDILAFGFNPKKTFIFSNLDFVGGAFYENIIGVARHISVKNIKTALGFGDDDNVGMFYCCSTQSAGTFATSFPGILGTNQDQLKSMSCLIACSYDIDGYFSEVRKHAGTLGYQRPAFLYSSLLPALQGAHAKMSASIPVSAIFLTDDASMIRDKLELAFPIGPDSAMNTETLFQYLRFFKENDEELESLERSFEAQELTEEALRASLTEAIQVQIAKFQKSRVQVTDDYLKALMTPRLLE
jgi:tryptophanyl-tRNA synthetase